MAIKRWAGETAGRIQCLGNGTYSNVVSGAAERTAAVHRALPTITPTEETIPAGVASRATEELAGIYQGTSPCAAAVALETGESQYKEQPLDPGACPA